MKLTRMDTPSTRAEFEERLNFAREQLINGMMHFAKGLRGPDSLGKVRYLPNGRIDFLSVDEMARLNANQTYQMRNVDFKKMLSDDTVHTYHADGLPTDSVRENFPRKDGGTGDKQKMKAMKRKKKAAQVSKKRNRR
jgi:hypothetical protein